MAGAVTGSQDDERGVAGTSGSSGQTPRVTQGPDLKSVAVVKGTDTFGNATYTAAYTFDQKVDAASLDPTKFKLWLSDGTELDGTGAVGSPTVDSATGTVVTVTTFQAVVAATAATAAQIGSATLGTVAAGAAGDATTTTTKNPEGSAFVTGGTGTPAT